MSGLCSNWATEADFPESCATDEVEPDTIALALRYASEILFNLTHRKYPGVCTDEYSPFDCDGCWFNNCALGYYGAPWRATLFHGEVRNFSHFLHEGIQLPGFPVASITSVTLNGNVVSPADYKVYDRRLLRRVDGNVWPCGFNYSTVEAFTIEYTWGRVPTPGLVRAAALLAWQFALAWTPNCAGQCRLPQRVQTITRQGTTYAIHDPLTLFGDGLTGIPDVDLLVQAHLRGEARQRATVAVPGKRRHGLRS